MSDQMLEVVNSKISQLRNVAQELEDTSRALAISGNLVLADRLEELAMTIQNAHREIEKAVYDDIRAQLELLKQA